MAINQCPESLKAVAHYLKVADEHDSRDIAISYWCRLYALEVSIKLSADNKTPEVNKFLLSIMDWLESTKKENATNEAITSKVCAQATIENYALKLFKYADEQDRAENWGKNVVKAFYTCGILMDVLTSFEELSEDIAHKRKYAKWKAAYIHNCLKSGERPTPGPIGSEEDDDFIPISKENDDMPSQPTLSNMGGPSMPVFPNPPSNNGSNSNIPSWPSVPPQPYVPPSPYVPPTSYVQPMISPHTQPISPTPSATMTPQLPGAVNLNPEQIQKAQKYCKWATSALNYDDIKSAIDSLQKALLLLQTGKDSPE